MKYFKIIAYNILGIFFWLVVFTLLKINCIVDIPGQIDMLWTKQIGKGFIVSLTGDIAFKTEIDKCKDWLIYNATYSPNDADKHDVVKNLTTTVDIDSWTRTEINPPVMVYEDKSFKYVVYNNSDGVYMRIFDK